MNSILLHPTQRKHRFKTPRMGSTIKLVVKQRKGRLVPLNTLKIKEKSSLTLEQFLPNCNTIQFKDPLRALLMTFKLTKPPHIQIDVTDDPEDKALEGKKALKKMLLRVLQDVVEDNRKVGKALQAIVPDAFLPPEADEEDDLGTPDILFPQGFPKDGNKEALILTGKEKAAFSQMGTHDRHLYYNKWIASPQYKMTFTIEPSEVSDDYAGARFQVEPVKNWRNQWFGFKTMFEAVTGKQNKVWISYRSK